MSACVGHVGEPCKTAEPIQMSFGTWTQEAPRNHLVDGARIAPCKGALRDHEPDIRWATDASILRARRKELAYSKCRRVGPFI